MHILNSVLGDASGGRWAVVCDYCRILLNQGHSVTLLLSRHHAPDPSGVPEGVAVEFTGSHGHYDFLAAWAVRRRFKPPPLLAIAHCSRSVSLLKRALPLTPLLAVSHSSKVRRLLPADVYLALNQDIKEKFQRAEDGKPCFVVPNMIAVRPEQRPQRHRRHQPLRIGALGRFDRVKGFDLYLEALGRLKQSGQVFHAQLAGTGTEEAALKRMATQLGLDGHLDVSGWVVDVDDFLKSLDILCVPARSDAFGLTPLQAARAGTPMVLSNAAGHRQSFAAEREALFAEVDDAEALARQLSRLIADPDLSERLRQAAFQRIVDCYAESVVAERIHELVEYTVNNIKL